MRARTAVPPPKFVYNKENIMKSLLGEPYFECIKLEMVSDRESGEEKEKYFISFKMAIEDSWLQNPPVAAHQRVAHKEESVGLFRPDVKLPIADRFLTPVKQEDKPQHGFMTAIPSTCSDPELDENFQAGPLVKNSGSAKVVELPAHLFHNRTSYSFKNKPFFHIPEYHARKSLQGSCTTGEILKGIEKRCAFLMDNWSLKKNLQGMDSDVPLCDSFTKDQFLHEISVTCKAARLAYISNVNVCDLSKATIASARDCGRDSVLADCVKGNSDRCRQELRHSRFNCSTLFGPVSDKLNTLIAGDVSYSPLALQLKGAWSTGGPSDSSKRKYFYEGGSGSKSARFDDKRSFFRGSRGAGRPGSARGKSRGGRGRGTTQYYRGSNG